jgi:hypothetical protein
MNIKVEIDLWDWSDGSKTETLDFTKDILNYRFQKTIKNPMGSCQISLLPQRLDTHILDILNTMDVVRIYEFDTLKFIGYIRRIGYSGSIGDDGKPSRSLVITCNQMGGLLQSASIGIGLGTAMGLEGSELWDAANKLTGDLRKASEDGVSFSEMVTTLIDSFISYLESLNANNFKTYLDEYFDSSTGLTSSDTPALPRTFELFTGTEQSLNFWGVAEQLVERPFNEFWIDTGPRKVSIDGSDVDLPEKSCLVFRSTPFNGKISGGVTSNLFDNLPYVEVDKHHLKSFNLSKGMDEVYTMYAVKEPAFQLSELTRLLIGQSKVDPDRVGKYLLKPLITELFFTRVENVDGDSVEATNKDLNDAAKDGADTLYNWFSKNDEYLSGVISIMVPSDDKVEDPKIGQKLKVYGIDGFFYIEGIAHTWTYRGSLKSDLTVTRGYNGSKPIKLKDRIFNRVPQ